MTSDEITKQETSAESKTSEPAPSSQDAPREEAPRRRRIVRSAATSAKVAEGGEASDAPVSAPPGSSEPPAASAGRRTAVHDYGRERHRAAPSASASPAGAPATPTTGAPSSTATPREPGARPARAEPPKEQPSILELTAPRRRVGTSTPGAGGWGARPPGPRPFQEGERPDDRPRRTGPPRDRFGGGRDRRGPDSRGPARPRFDSAPGEQRRDDRRPSRPSGPAQPVAAKPAVAAPPPAPPPMPKPVPVPAGVPLPRVGHVAPKSNKPALTAKEALRAKTRAAQSATSKSSDVRPDARQDSAVAAAATFDERTLAASWDDALAAITAAGDAAPALIDAWASASNAAPVAAVAESHDAPGRARKAARRALNVLKARGVSIPERQRVARFVDEAPALVEATLIPPDSSGAEAITISVRDPGGRYHVAEIIIRDAAGILQAGSAWLSLSHLKEGRTRAVESLGFGPIAVPVAWARWRIAESLRQNTTAKRVVPLGYERCREIVEPAPEQEPAHPVADLEASMTSERAWSASPGSANLHEEPEFRSWIPDRGALEELLRNVGERLGPDGARDPERVGEALREEILAATDRFFSPEVRTTIVRRMRDSAISVRARRGDERATEVIAVARAVQEAGLITSPPRDIPFLKSFFDKAIGYLAQQGGGSLRIPMAQPPAPTP